MPRYLTKSRFTLGAQCATKLYYYGKSEYLDNSVDDTFLGALAEGGYQVGKLACLAYPDGVLVEGLNHEQALAATADLLKLPRVTIFEAALTSGPYFIRVDILQKDGDRIDIIEVKAKSYERDDGELRGKRGGISADFKPYLLDVAFQRHVVRLALPGLQVRAFLMLVNKDAIATVDGLNARFKVSRDGRRLRVDYVPPEPGSSIGDSLLYMLNVDSQTDQIALEPLPIGGGSTASLGDAAATYADAVVRDAKLAPAPSDECGKCQFKADSYPAEGALRSGFHECWSEAFRWGPDDFADGTVLDLWNCRRKDKFVKEGVLKLAQVTQELLDYDGKLPGAKGLEAKHRQWYLCAPDWPNGGEFYFDADGMRREMAGWTFPLHFIDFETCLVAIPFTKGRHPYAVTAFQFSHHTLGADGATMHQTQWLLAEPGIDPNFEFVRQLKNALQGDQGTVFRWADHERTVLNQIREQLLTGTEPPADTEELVAFIDSIAGKGENVPRAMVDLRTLSGSHFFHPMTKGSASLKKVLPALMHCSLRLRELYSQPTYGPGISKNITTPVAWWQQVDGKVIDPYLLLPPLFEDCTREEVEALDVVSEELREGGAAMAAYVRLQAENLPGKAGNAIKAGLLRYCELDTLAMVMVVQAWQAWCASE